MKQITSVFTEYIDEERNVQLVDVYYDNDEEGVVAAEICLDTGKVFYRDPKYRSEPIVKETIHLITKSIDPVKGAKRILADNGWFCSLWHTEDILHAAEMLKVELTDKQIEIVKKQIDKYHNAEIGINWDVINFWIEEVIKMKNLKY